MATSQYTSAADIKAQAFGGLMNEDLMQQIWDVSKIPLPYTDMVASDTATNPHVEWIEDKLPTPVIGGWLVDGQDSDKNNSVLGTRLGNQCGQLDREVQVTERAQNSSTPGGNALSYQVMMRQQELKRNVEANLLANQGSVADNGDTVPGQVAGLPAMLTKQANGNTGSGGAFNTGTGLFSAWTPGAAPVALSETMIRDAAQAAWESGSNPTKLMSVPNVIRNLSEYMFTSSSRIATLTRETQGVGKGGSGTAMGSVNVFITDFGVTLEFVPNRLQLAYQTVDLAAAAAVFILDPEFLRITYLKNVRTLPLAKTGSTDKRQMLVDFTQKVLVRDSGRALMDIDVNAAVAA